MALTYQNEIGLETLIDMPGDVKVEEQQDSRGQNTSDFTLSKEDHTVAHLLRMKLHTNRSVKFAAYRVPHPTKHDVVVKVQTAAVPGKTDIPTPASALRDAIEECVHDVDDFAKAFDQEMARWGAEAP